MGASPQGREGARSSLYPLRLPGKVRAVVGCKIPGVVKKNRWKGKKTLYFFF